MIDFQNGSIFKLKKVEDAKFADEMRPLLVENEIILGCYQDIRDHVVFTDKRIISVNVQGITGKKKDFTSLPYSKVSVFSIETAGTFDLDSELDLFYSGVGRVRFEFRGGSDIIKIGQMISRFALR
jgi:hypothetical protein